MADDKRKMPKCLRLGRDVLDSQMIDSNKRQSGKVDGIVGELRQDGRLVIVALENGMPEAFGRVSPALGGWIASIGRRWGVRNGRVYRIPFSKVREVGINLRIDLDATRTPLFAWESWLRRHVVRHIPGAGS